MTSTRPAREIAFFLPAHNEAENLPEVVRRAATYLEANATAYEIIIVDDGSADSTAEVGRAISREYANVRVVSHAKNLGYGAAVRTGLTESAQAGMTWIAFCDSDGQFDPAEVDKLIVAAEDGDADAVIGYRVVRADGLRRRVLGRAWHSLTSKILGFHARDVDCGFKLFRSDAIRTIAPQLRGVYATISPELLMRLQVGGFRISEEGVSHSPRLLGEQSGANLHVVWMSLRGLIQLRREIRKEARHVDTRVRTAEVASADPASR